MKENKYKLTIKDLKVQDRRKKITEQDVYKMKQLRKQNLSYAKIAGILGLTYVSVYTYLNPQYHSKLKKYNYRNYRMWAQTHKEKMSVYRKRYYKRRKSILDNMDLEKLGLVPTKNTIKNRILNFLVEDRDYKFSEIKNFLNKDYPFFSRVIHQLAKQNLIEIKGVRGNQYAKRIK